MSKKQENMKKGEHPFLEKPKDFDMGKPPKDGTKLGGGGNDGKKE